MQEPLQHPPQEQDSPIHPHHVGISHSASEGVHQKAEGRFQGGNNCCQVLVAHIDDRYPGLHLPREQIVVEDPLEKNLLGLQHFFNCHLDLHHFLNIEDHQGPIICITT